MLALVAVELLTTGMAGFAQKHDTLSFSATRQQTQQRFGLDPAIPLTNRVSQTPGDVLKRFKEAGMSPTEHIVTEEERKIISAAFAMLPPLHQRVLKERLKDISLLDNMPNTALTSTLNFEEPYNLYHITIRAGVLHETVSQWLNWKERGYFDTLQARARVNIEGGRLNALVYVLLHETTHILDAALGITSRLPGKLLDSSTFSDFAAGIWEDRTTLTPPLKDSLLLSLNFREGGKLLPVDQAVMAYRSLQKLPFVSLYSVSARTEDLAEYVTVYHLTHQLKQPFRIVVKDGNRQLFSYEPMKSALVKSRIQQMKYFYTAG